MAGKVGFPITNIIMKSSSEPLRIICFGAHPDDCEFVAGGVGLLWSRLGHEVKFVSTTNGDIGHWRDAGGSLARRRKLEVEEAARILGNTTEVLDIHDGELMPTLENRRKFIRLIREWNADIVISHRPYDYHPDHRYTAVLVQDSAFMVTVPFICPDVPPLKKNPVFLYAIDLFQKPQPFQPDIVVDVSSVMEEKLQAFDAMESQFLEGGCLGSEALIPKSPAQKKERVQQVRKEFLARFDDWTRRYRKGIESWYGAKGARKVRYIEAFEVCEYGRQPDRAELKRLFPFFGK